MPPMSSQVNQGFPNGGKGDRFATCNPCGYYRGFLPTREPLPVEASYRALMNWAVDRGEEALAAMFAADFCLPADEIESVRADARSMRDRIEIETARWIAERDEGERTNDVEDSRKRRLRYLRSLR